MARSFKIEFKRGPDGLGILRTQYRFVVDFEYDPGSPGFKQSGTVYVIFTDGQAHAISGGHVDNPPYRDAAIARVRYLVTERLKTILASPNPDMRQSIIGTYEDVDHLLTVDPLRSGPDAWVQIPAELTRARNRVFISCGQSTPDERAVGQKIARLVKTTTGLDAYFAEDQSSLEGLTANIFNALYESAAFVAIMHRRDGLDQDASRFRGSIWIEQEIAIASFMVQSLGIALPSKAYIQEGVERKGVREFIILNPHVFKTTDEIEADLQLWLQSIVPALT